MENKELVKLLTTLGFVDRRLSSDSTPIYAKIDDITDPLIFCINFGEYSGISGEEGEYREYSVLSNILSLYIL